jgi:hypothetical protein
MKKIKIFIYLSIILISLTFFLDINLPYKKILLYILIIISVFIDFIYPRIKKH